MADSITIKTDNGYGTYDGRYLQLDCEQTNADTSTNTSTIKWTLSSVGGNVNYYSTGPTTVIINGTTVYSSSRVDWTTYKFPAKKGSISGTMSVSHTNDGSKTISVSVSTVVYHASSHVQTYSGSWTLNKINRGAIIVSAENFDSEHWNPALTYSNPLGLSFQCCISFDNGQSANIPYRTVGSAKSGSWNFELTDNEKNTFKTATANKSSMAVLFIFRTTVNGSYVYSSMNKTFTVIKNANTLPVVNPTATVDATTLSLTGSNDIFIKGVTDLTVSDGASAQWGASIKKRVIKCGDINISTASGTLSNVLSNALSFSVTDTRDFTTVVTPTKTIVDYIPVTASLAASNPNGEGEAVIEVSGKYFDGSFGAQSNALTIQYRTKEEGGAYGDWVTIPYSPSGNSYDVTYTVTGLDYTKKITFQAQAIDKVMTAVTGEQARKAVPLFSWGKDVFNFNTNLRFDDGEQTAERNITFRNTAGRYPHDCYLYGGNPNSETAFGIWDAKNSRFAMQYLDVYNQVRIAPGAATNVYINGCLLALQKDVRIISNMSLLNNTPSNFSGYGRCIEIGKSDSDKYYLLIDHARKLFVGTALNGVATITWVEK